MTDALYSEFFGLKFRPFNLVPDPAMIFWSQIHKRAYTILEFGVMSRAPITLITGEIGAGKTTLLQALLGKMDETVTIGLISNAQGGRGELVQWILNALGQPVEPGLGYVAMFQMLRDFLVEEYAQGRRVILIFDEAQNLSLEGLEELRMLTNINANQDELLQLILVGQPELRDMVRGPSMRQLAQRVAASFHLDVLDAPSVQSYVQHRLMAAGGTGQEFTPEACALVHSETGGVPRLVNQLCDFAMLYAWSGEVKVIDHTIVQLVLNDGVLFAAPNRREAEHYG
ncbi:MAG: ATPase [Rhodobacteraceae bacterium]|nr:ATPase [Paracoccaceae bacterium]